MGQAGGGQFLHSNNDKTSQFSCRRAERDDCSCRAVLCSGFLLTQGRKKGGWNPQVCEELSTSLPGGKRNSEATQKRKVGRGGG